MSVLSSLVLGEAIVHGLDIARVEKAEWPISSEEARLINAGGTHLIPYFVNPEVAGDLRATYRIRLRGGETFLIVFKDGTLAIASEGTSKPDVTVSIDPVTWLLIGYGRTNQYLPSLTGKMFVYGRKPWLGLKLGSAFNAP